MSKRVRQYIGLFAAIVAYYVIHEGAHLVYPLYLSLLCGMFGGGDMNGISLLAPEMVTRIGYGVLLVVNVIVFFKVVLTKYKLGFKE